LGDGSQYMPWIHIDDMIGIIHFLIEQSQVSGSVNATAPNPVTNAVFTKSLASALHRPAIFTAPAPFLRLGLGEMARLLLTGQRAIPRKLLDAGYKFRFTDLESALQDLLH
ncbi:MAG: DUF1731 domain-containing protein, partial [Oleiphilaceae bacterium]|nr:DUF1731 domain-containing protein [Oleiphilaceae bacterium]